MSDAVGFESSIHNSKPFMKIMKLRSKTKKAVRASWFDLGRDLKNEANKEILRKPKGGKTYWIRTQSGRRKRHVASKPGETHANLSGTLRRSISWKVHSYQRMEFGYGFATNSSNRAPVYDFVIEDGFNFKDGRKIKPRPSIANAVGKVKRNTKIKFQKQMLKEFKRV
jgi:hypothetical protein